MHNLRLLALNFARDWCFILLFNISKWLVLLVPSAGPRSSEFPVFASYSRLCPGSADFPRHQQTLSSCASTPQGAVFTHPPPQPLQSLSAVHPVSPSLLPFPSFYFLFSFPIQISLLQAFSPNLLLKIFRPIKSFFLPHVSQVATSSFLTGANRSH